MGRLWGWVLSPAAHSSQNGSSGAVRWFCPSTCMWGLCGCDQFVPHQLCPEASSPGAAARLIRGRSCHQHNESDGGSARTSAVAPCHSRALTCFICGFGCSLSRISKVNIGSKISSRPLWLGSLVEMLSTATINIHEVLQGTELSFPLPSRSGDDSPGHAVLPCTSYGHLLYIIGKARGTGKPETGLPGSNVAQRGVHTLQPLVLPDLSN